MFAGFVHPAHASFVKWLQRRWPTTPNGQLGLPSTPLQPTLRPRPFVGSHALVRIVALFDPLSCSPTPAHQPQEHFDLESQLQLPDLSTGRIALCRSTPKREPSAALLEFQVECWRCQSYLSCAVSSSVCGRQCAPGRACETSTTLSVVYPNELKGER